MSKSLSKIIKKFIQHDGTEELLVAYIEVSFVCDFHEDAFNHLIDLAPKTIALKGIADHDEWQKDRQVFKRLYYSHECAWSSEEIDKAKVAYLVWY